MLSFVPTPVAIHAQIASQFPEFIRTEGPRFVQFLETYFKYTEQQGNAVAAARALSNNLDIDTTDAALIEYFRREFLHAVPANALADQRQLVKYIRAFFRARGSTDAYRFLFRILFNTEVEFYRPSEDILRTSDGRWVIETILSVSAPFTSVPTSWIGAVVEGQNSTARGRVEDVLELTIGGVTIYELTISNVVGDFVGEELIVNLSTGDTATVNTTTGPLTAAALTSFGAFHDDGDAVSYVEPTNSGAGASGKVTQTTDTSALTLKIIRGGSGYRLSTPIMLGPSIGFDAKAHIASLANTETINLNTDIINSVKNVPINTGPKFPSTGANSTVLNTNLANANDASTLSAALTFVPTTVGRINIVQIDSVGQGYNRHQANGLPKVTVEDTEVSQLQLPDGRGGLKGKNAVLVANNAPGALLTASVLIRGLNYHKNERIEVLNTTKGTSTTDDAYTDAQTGQAAFTRRQLSYTANGASIPGGTTFSKGRYTDTKGFLSWNNKLQDGFFYQQFSYAIRCPVPYTDFAPAVKRLLHPAGTALFGILQITNEVSMVPSAQLLSTFKLHATADLPAITGFLDIADAGLIAPYYTDLPVADISAVLAANSAIHSWAYDAGTVSILDLSLIQSLASNAISNFANVHISTVMNSNTVLFGVGTSFNTEILPHVGRGFIIEAVSEPTANGLYTSTRVANNTWLEFTPPYAGNYLTSGKLRY